MSFSSSLLSPTAREHTPPAIIPAGAARRILVCQLRQIGDVLLATPSIELLAKRYPQAQIFVFTEKKCQPMLENNPHVHAVLALDKKDLPTLLHEYRFYHRISSGRFDIVVDFQQLPRCRAVVAMSRSPLRLSFPPPWYLRPLYTHWTQPAPAYAAAYKAGVLAPLGIFWNGERPRLYLTEQERTRARDILASLHLAGKRFVCVDATHRHPTRRWPARHYAALLDMLAEKLPDMHFLLPYGPGEEKDTYSLRSFSRHPGRLLIPPSLFSLREMAACMEHAVLHLGNCSAPRHMAVALDVPSVTIMGATGPGWLFPSPEHIGIQAKSFMPMSCQHCNKNTCAAGVPCLEKLAPELVFPNVLKHLQNFGHSKENSVATRLPT